MKQHLALVLPAMHPSFLRGPLLVLSLLMMVQAALLCGRQLALWLLVLLLIVLLRWDC